jgi:hypothetical protein
MKTLIKTLIVLLCLFLCAGGVVLSPKEKAQDNRAKSKIVPVDNREQNRASWVWA